ncbi:Protein in NOF-FB transposable element [Aphis craccivora]|uniref:Protein in NOF-FB transposable element n=1 Tax=Aphis craccivora TaxID=307492 RepID=A0A6G0YRR6_APHCR|nr:Protein in NOF-FB transposable element [Aphis craccivora]
MPFFGSVLKNVEEIANFIQQKYPTMEFGNTSVSNEAISDICKVILKKADCKKAKNNLVMALNNPNSALRKLLDSNSTVDNKSHFYKMLQDKGYSKNDFCIYKTDVVNSICKILKTNCSRKNQHIIFQRCQESFRQNEISISPKEIVISDEGNNTSNIIVDKLGIDQKENVFEIKEHDLINGNSGLSYSSCKVYDDCCSTIEEIDNQHIIFQRCRESFQEYEISDSLQELSQKEIVMLGETNRLNESTAVGVKRRLFDHSTPQKENNNTSNIDVKKLENDLTEEVLEIKEHDLINFNPGLLNSSFSIDDGCCGNIQENEYNKNFDSIKQIDVAEEMLTTPKRKLNVTFSEDLFTPEKGFKSVSICNTPEADLKALPKNSKNVYPLKVRSFNEENKMKKVICYKKCNFVEGTISLQDKELKQIVDNTMQKNIVISNETNDLLREKFETVNNSCVLTIKNKNITKKGMTCYGICRHESCKQFKLVVEKKTMDSMAQLTVLSNSHNYSHYGKLTTFLKGTNRQKQKEMSKYCPPMSLRQKFILKASPSKLKRGNLCNIRSDRVYYKVSHEQKSRDDRAADDRVDMHLLKDKCSEFIQYVSDPKEKDFETYLFSQDQVNVLRKIKCITIHVDATGGVVRETTRDPTLFKTGKRKEKLLLYYAAVTVFNNRIIPIAEYLSTTQTASAITNWLTEFRKFYERQCGTKFIAHVVSDFSTAILKGFVRAFTECNEVVEYLNRCYEFMYEGKMFNCNALISLCCCHLIKNISDDAHKYFKGNGKKMTNGSLACLATACISPAFNITSTECLDKWFTAVTTVLLSPCKTVDVDDAMETLKQLSHENPNSLVDDLITKQNNITLDEQIRDVKTFYRYKDSKFLSRFKNIVVQVKKTLKICPSFEQNPLYSVEFHNDIMGSIIPVIPMWTGVMRFKVFGSTDRASNAPAESWFGDLKTNKKCRRMKCGRFVQFTRSIILSKCKEVLLDIPSNYCALPPVQNKQKKIAKKESTSFVNFISSSSDDNEEKECWGPRKKKTGFYFKGHLKAASKQFKTRKVMNYVSPMENVKDDTICLTPNPNVNMPSFGSITINDEMVTPNTKTLSESFISIKSYKSPVDGLRCKMDLYENRLPKDKNYYSSILKKNGRQLDYVVGVYNSVKDITQCQELFFSDFDTLSMYTPENIKKMWLSNFVIDIALGVMKQTYCEFKNKIKILSCDVSGHLNNDPSKKISNLETIVVPKESLLVMPLHVNGNHWVIMFVDFGNHKFYFFDPFETTEYNKCRHNFVTILSELKKNHVYGEVGNVWPEINFQIFSDYPKQTDSYNCGVYVLYYAECMMKNKIENQDAFEKFCEMADYRKHPSAMVSIMNYNYIPSPDNHDLNDTPFGAIKHRQGCYVQREGVKNA